MIFTAYTDNSENLFDISIKSCGHIFAENGRRIHRPTGRADWLLFYVAKGRERFYLDGQTDAHDGDFILFRPHEKQEHICISPNTSEFYYIHFTAPADFDLFGFQSSHVYKANFCPAVRDLFNEVLEELQTKRSAYHKVCITKFMCIMSLLSRNVSIESNAQSKHMNAISSVVQRMNSAYYENDTLEDYAQMCKMSKFHFLRVFKSVTGASPLEYRNNIRLEHAKELLEDNLLPINEIAQSLGFSSASYFCDTFKSKVGLSPMQYRQRLK